MQNNAVRFPHQRFETQPKYLLPILMTTSEEERSKYTAKDIMDVDRMQTNVLNLISDTRSL
jgi:hypothetical protein